jgi:uncharacterized protein with HEPN domain
MTAQRDFLDYIEDIRGAIVKARHFVKGMDFEQFSNDEKTSFAVVRALEIIGEAAKGVPEDARDRHAGLPWREMAGMRDKLAHDYFGVNLQVVWRTVTEDLPAIEPLIQNILEDNQEK